MTPDFSSGPDRVLSVPPDPDYVLESRVLIAAYTYLTSLCMSEQLPA